MSKMKRINYIIQAVLMILSVVLLISIPEYGYAIIAAILSLYLLIYGVNQLMYYLTLAKYMVGGRMILLRAVIVICLGLESAALTDVPKIYVMIYLTIGLVFKGVIDIFSAIDVKKREGMHWKIKFAQGAVTILSPLIGLFFVNSTNVVIYFYCFGVLTAAFIRLTEAFRKTAVVYIK